MTYERLLHVEHTPIQEPPSAARTFLDEMVLDAQVWENGVYRPYPAMSGPEEYDFGSPVGRTRVYRTLHSEPATLPQSLAAKGVAFEHYDFPGVTRKGDVHVAGARKNAWFKDPDGNILALVNA